LKISIIIGKNLFIKSVSRGLGANIIVFLLGIVSGVLTARGLGPEGKGVLTAILVIPFLLTPILNLGLDNSNVYLINRHPTKGAFLFANSLWVLLIVFPVLVVGQALIPKLMHSYGAKEIFLARIYLFGAAMGIFLSNVESLLRGLRKFYQLYTLRVLFPMISVLMLFVFFMTGLSVTKALLSNIVGGVSVIVVGLFFLRKSMTLSFAWDKRLLKESVSYGMKSYVGTLSSIVQLRVDQLIMILLVSTFHLGLYSVAARMSEALWQISNAVGTVLFPETSKRDSEKASLLIVKSLLVSMLLLVIIGGLLFFFAPSIVLLFFGRDFLGVTGVFRILIFASIAMGLARVLTEGLNGLGVPILPTYGSLCGLLANVPLLLILIPKYNIVGAAIASVIAYSCNLLVLLFLFRRVANSSYYSMLKNSVSLLTAFPTVVRLKKTSKHPHRHEENTR